MGSHPPDGEPPPAPAGSSETFFAQVYDELRAIAHARMRGERSGQSLQSTELVEDYRAIDRLAERDERAAQVVRLRFYGGLDVEETAEALGTSTRTVLRDWAFARAWLYGELSDGAC